MPYCPRLDVAGSAPHSEYLGGQRPNFTFEEGDLEFVLGELDDFTRETALAALKTCKSP
jgi:hypothetical protein